LVAGANNFLADVMRDKGDLDEAEKLYQKTLESFRKLGKGAPPQDLAITLFHLGNVYEKKHQPELAKPLYYEALDMRKKIFGNNHPYVRLVRDTLIDLLKRQNDSSELERLLTERAADR
jgi:tetratricopeptide (TPR) repeat protein